MTESSKTEPTSSPSYEPATSEEKEEAFRLAAQLLREMGKEEDEDETPSP
jgi:hypothetical protein